MALAIWLSACGLRGQERPPFGGEVPMHASRGTVSVTAGQVTKRGSQPPYEVDLTYPQIAYAGRPGVEAAVNAAVRKEIEAALSGFVEGLERGQGPGFSGGAGAPPSSLEGTYETVLLDDAAASFRLTLIRYLSGAAHPSGQHLGATFDLSTGRRYLLEDLFEPGAPYLERLSGECRRKLAAELGADADPRSVEEGTTPEAGNFAGWALSATALEVTFAEYQVGAYALGMPRCAIPRASLQDLAAEDGPLASR